MFFIKFILTALLVTAISEFAKRLPVFSGMIAAMPITTLIILFWLNYDTKDMDLITTFTISVFWAIFPTLIFFLVAIYLFKRGVSFYPAMAISMGVFLMCAFLHQKILSTFLSK